MSATLPPLCDGCAVASGMLTTDDGRHLCELCWGPWDGQKPGGSE